MNMWKRICVVALFACGLAAPAAVRAAPELSAEDKAALEALFDLGLTPTEILDMIRTELNDRRNDGPAALNSQETAGSGTLSADPSSQPDALVLNGVKTVVINEPERVAVDDFKTGLAPYGTWFTLQPYGYVWRPTVTTVNASWRPYCDRGRWVWTDRGWYWDSYYSWGATTFHYGRWEYTARYGWVWIPDTLWAPAWVHWRWSDGYFAWAPLPFGTSFTIGVGFTYGGARVAADCSFGLTCDRYVYVPSHRFCEPNLTPVVVEPRRKLEIHRDSVVIQRSYETRDGNVIDYGIPKDTVEKATRRTINVQRIVRRKTAAPVQAETRTYASSTPSQSSYSGLGGAMDMIARRETSMQVAPAAAAPYAPEPRNYWPSGGRGESVLQIVRQPRENTVAAPKTTAPIAAAAPSASEPGNQRSSGGRSESVLQMFRRPQESAGPAPKATAPAKTEAPPADARSEKSSAPADDGRSNGSSSGSSSGSRGGRVLDIFKRSAGK